MIEVFNCEDCPQGSDEWFRARMGLPTASQFATVMAKGKGGGESKTRKAYMHKLAGEILTGEPMDSFSNHHTERGHEMEPEARDLYAFLRDCEPQLVGFIRNGNKGASPDSLVDDDGAVEIKTKLPHLQIDCLLCGDVPPEHKAQCQGILWVAEREWIDFVSFWPNLPLHVHREHRDEEYIAKIAAAVDQFNDELAAVVERVRAMGGDRQLLSQQLTQSLEAA
jgi:hypothetical protein